MQFLDTFLTGYHWGKNWSHVSVKIKWLKELNVYDKINLDTTYVHFHKSTVYIKYPECYNIFKDAYQNLHGCNPGLQWKVKSTVTKAERYKSWLSRKQN